ncbi:MAG: diaminopimelate epimerase [Lachnospiraceae bacterium]|nr:diaminopimelate epimerase [Lachnospiraceae bacterium]MBQ1721660.1 diaminopimelate epimerase [Lachnospiraceae bacterium]MBQ2503283.1 diaminopimelate epimerase [Lachnospiraceae bacterium]MBR0428681.1 diaminopimelate epimerase [Lachnospiraceae bacterium]
MKFTKMQGCGNDYVYVDCTKEALPNPEQAAIFVSDRHFGIGSDGLILINPSKVADFEMAMYNADGSRSEMCGNGIRCVGKYVYDHGLTDKTTVTIETLAGIKTLELHVENGKVASVRVNMGRPELHAAKVPVTFPEETMIDEPMEIDGTIYQVTCVSMGNPHCVIFMDEDVRQLDLEELGPKFENHVIFPKRTNTEFCNLLDKQHIRMRVWERGSGETLACGTGACATAVAAVLNGYTDNKVELQLRGGNLLIEYDRDAEEVYMTGPATTVFEGEIDLPENWEDDTIRIYHPKR